MKMGKMGKRRSNVTTFVEALAFTSLFMGFLLLIWQVVEWVW